jgi:hypothetical protein
MATHVAAPNTSHCVRSVLQNSTAFAESRPRVELSQHCNGAKLRAASAIETRLRSPPLTPLTKSLPTFVFTVWLTPNIAIITWSMSARGKRRRSIAYITQMPGIVCSADTTWNLSRSARQSSKVQRVSNAQLREVGVYFSGVDGFTSKSSFHILG